MEFNARRKAAKPQGEGTENKFENLRVLALERFNYFCSRKKAQESQEKAFFAHFVIFCGYGFC